MAGHDHDHDDDHKGHSHAVAADADRKWLWSALVLLSAFMVGEVVVGFAARSLALISDAAHMLTDTASIALALVAMRLAARPARGGYTYGLKRAEILSAQANGVTLLVLSAWLGYEAVTRLVSPPEVAGGLVLVTALVGVVVNVAATWCMSKANRSSLNVEGAFQHVLTDLYAFVATAVAGAVVLLTGFVRADAIASLVVVALMLRAGIGLVRDSARIFLEAAPAGVDPDEVADRMVSAPQVEEVHDLHIWEITSNEPALSAHVLVTPGGDCHAVQRELQRRLREEYRITHATLQVDHVGEDGEDGLLQIAPSSAAAAAAAEQAKTAGDAGRDHCGDVHGPVHRSGPHPH
ncbi:MULTISPECIES: cation diffusion facilitator family transporter [Kitasatospora]|uniref:Putative cation efflux protein n=1 Tax=Kitasatospora setae (strain ATCC 33774 / DSM 43861 / JCM 3304 / KCC A-0304 / NBRC 14216 / KM-6054) TaxID=452652 RepID=E4N300_KITSK|nr:MULTISPECIES: cation diffusion facilitator family transporter [Kitasatospora]BAJ32534.1 putative cation efflux protein [Kitasatospora setae KM-6054]